MGQILDLDNTKRTAFVTCPRKYYWAYVRNLAPFIGSTALRYGSAWHAMMEELYRSVLQEGWKDLGHYIPQVMAAAKAKWDKESLNFTFYDDYRSLENLGTSFLLWKDTFSNDPTFLEVVQLERRFEIPLPSFEDSIVFTGRIDMDVKLSGIPYMFEHKTTGTAVTMAASRLHRSPQMLGYTWAEKQQGIDMEGALVCIHHISARKNKDGVYGKPTIAFHRSPQLYTKHDLDDWLDSFKYTAEKVLEAREKNRFPMHHDNCYQFGACKYTGLCEQDHIRDLEEVNTSDFVTYKWDVREEE